MLLNRTWSMLVRSNMASKKCHHTMSAVHTCSRGPRQSVWNHVSWSPCIKPIIQALMTIIQLINHHQPSLFTIIQHHQPSSPVINHPLTIISVGTSETIHGNHQPLTSFQPSFNHPILPSLEHHRTSSTLARRPRHLALRPSCVTSTRVLLSSVLADGEPVDPVVGG